jgi:ribosome-binding protein aMBF1 (putative translation factor)
MKKPAAKKAVPQRILREFTPAERKRWEQAVAEETSPEAVSQARRIARSAEQGETLLRDAVRMLRAERERQGLSLAQVAERCDMERSAVCRLETSAVPNPTVATLCAWAAALGKEIVITLRDAPPPTRPSARR